MANKAASDAIKSSGDYVFATLTHVGWDKALVLNEAGQVNVEESKRAMLRALSMHLREKGVLKVGGFAKAGPSIDLDNTFRALYQAFAKLAKGDAKASINRTELVTQTCMDLQVPAAEFAKALREVQACIDHASSPFQSVTGERKFDGTKVILRNQNVALQPVPFRFWGQTEAAPAPAPAAPVEAPKAAPKGKGKGK